MPDRPPLPLPVIAAGRSRATCDAPAEPHPDEFASGAAVWNNRFSRRNFLSLASASLAMAGLTGCSDRPDEPIVPYVDPPEQVVAGEPQFFATTLTRGGYGRGVIVTSREGRPVKIEGNPDHPASLGAADAQTQAAALGLYDPLRSKSVTHAGQPATWGAFREAFRNQLAKHDTDGGAGLVVLTGAVTSPTLSRLLDEIIQKYPQFRWHVAEPVSRKKAVAAASVQGEATRCEWVYDLSTADVVVSFDSDFMADGPGSIVYARQCIDNRRLSGGRRTMNRLYVAEADVSTTGTRADHRLAVRPSRAAVLLSALLTQMAVHDRPTPQDLTPAEAEWIAAVSTDLNAARGRSLVITGVDQPTAVQKMAASLNVALGNAGKTVRRVPTPLADEHAAFTDSGSFKAILERGTTRTVLVLVDNFVRAGVGDRLGDALAAFSRRPDVFTAHLGLYANETAFACQWHVPAQHELETWGDARAYDGTASVIQPLIAPLFGGKSAVDLLNLILGRVEQSAYDTVRTTWSNYPLVPAAEGFEAWWARTLRRGVVEGSAAASVDMKGESTDVKLPEGATQGIELVFKPDASVHDGSLFHNPWLQELPRPLTKIVWGNAALLSPATMTRLGLSDTDIVKVALRDREIEIPTLGVTGVADDVAVLHLGYGEHKIVGGDAAWAESNLPRGVDVYPLRSAGAETGDFAIGAAITATGKKGVIVRTHGHHDLAAEAAADPTVKKSLTPHVVATPDTADDDLRLHNRRLIRTATLEQFAAEPAFAMKMDEGDIKQLYPAWDYSTGPQWGMTIDLNACIGCQACVIACQAENNIPTVGPEQVAAEREMQWLRVDQYVDEGGKVYNQPVPCMHCENAPCEYVCPVAATTHSVDGLNQMTYNRCVGTRYCSNNCPYKVRRFNFLNYTFYKPEQYKNQANPDVTVRTRGVMEKCSYCVQRLNYADRKTEIATVNAGDADTTRLRNDMFGRVQTACQQTCPTRAIEFGDLTNKASPVAISKQSPRNYGILTELSTKPRTTYLAEVTNPSPMLVGAKGGA